ncbi:MAG: hypothetical protein OEV42_14825 [Deltaproteobacteria bacterium]|nr:hypothetical protein [Deltaproteobacteria bacterium]
MKFWVTLKPAYMKKNLVIPVLLALLFGGQPALAKTINLPTIPIEVAVHKAKKYVVEQKIDVSNAFIGVVEYHNLYNKYERPYWRVRWVRKIGVKGGWFELRLFSDGSVEERPGKQAYEKSIIPINFITVTFFCTWR